MSWSYVMTNWLKLMNSPEVCANPNRTYNEMKLALQDIATHLGGLTVDSVLAMFLHPNSQHFYQDIGNAIDGRRAISRDVAITSRDVLELLSRHANAANDIASSSLLSYTSAAPNQRPNLPYKQLAAPTCTVPKYMESVMNKNNQWAKANLTWKNPCLYCYDWGHWPGDCPQRHQKLPPLGDPRRFNPQARLKKSTVCHPVFNRAPGPAVASVGYQPDTHDAALLDSGATDSVTDDVSFSHP